MQPQLGRWLDALSALTGLQAMVSGSGSSVFVEVPDESVLVDAAADPLLATARRLSIVRPVGHGPVIRRGQGQAETDQ